VKVDDAHIGRRVREIRHWRGLSLTTTAGLAGISHSYLSLIERGLRPVTKRSTLEALANALRVSPAELTGRPFVPVDSTSNTAHAALGKLEAALTEWWPGEVPDDTLPRAWPDVLTDVTLLNEKLRPNSDYAAMGILLPGLVHDLLVYAGDHAHRQDALTGLIHAYHATGRVATAMGSDHLGYVAAERVQRTAEQLADPEWLGLAAWTRAQYVSALSRPRQYALAVAAAEMPDTRWETRGMSHLTAALAAASQGDTSKAEVHLAEAGQIADHLGLANSRWGGATLNFGIVNVGIWKITVGVELGYGGRIAEIARNVQWPEITQSRQGAYWMDLGRGLLQDKHTREQGVRAILRAEELTPQQVRNNPFVREAVGDALRAARREAGGRELRYLAYRMGLAPNG
jgi:transcriptional regulator with XRE-family HTH domain